MQGEPFNVSLQFKAVQNYPADLYYLMDVSYSMNDDKTNLARLGGSLVSASKSMITVLIKTYYPVLNFTCLFHTFCQCGT